MKIAILVNVSVEPYNGVKIQAETWADELERKGHEVYRISPWEKYDWKSFDVIHVIGPMQMLYHFCLNMQKLGNHNIVLSPIIDTNKSYLAYKLSTFIGSKRLRLVAGNYMLRACLPMIDLWNVRTDFEASYLTKCYGVSDEKIVKVPLSYRVKAPKKLPQKENFCFHVSRLSSSNKNVHRLVEAAIKYKFPLKLAGVITEPETFKETRRLIEESDNIEYLGKLTDEQLCNYYMKAKVFALPSISEGVGMVALEAACYGCNIVITKVGGPKEYFSSFSEIVDPYSVDSIGQGILKALSDNENNAKVREHVINNYNLSHCVDMLIESYKKVLKGKV